METVTTYNPVTKYTVLRAEGAVTRYIHRTGVWVTALLSEQSMHDYLIQTLGYTTSEARALTDNASQEG